MSMRSQGRPGPVSMKDLSEKLHIVHCFCLASAATWVAELRIQSPLMQDWPVELVDLILLELQKTSSSDVSDSVSDLCWDPDVVPDPTAALSDIGCLTLTCQRLRTLAQHLLFETIYLDSENTYRAEHLQDLMNTNPHLLSSTRHLVIGKFSIRSIQDLGPDDGFTISTIVAGMLPSFRNLTSLRLSALSFRSLTEATSLASIGYLQELHVDACSFASVTILSVLITAFYALRALILRFEIEYKSSEVKDRFSGQKILTQTMAIMRGQSLAPSSLESLELRSMGYLTISTQKLVKFLIATNRFRSLRSLHLEILGCTYVIAIHGLVELSAHTLTSLTFNCNARPGAAILPSHCSLTELRYLHLQNVGMVSFEAVVNLYTIFAKSHCPSEIILDLNFGHNSIDSIPATSLWYALENVQDCDRLTLHVSFYTLIEATEDLATEHDIRAYIPRRDSSGGVKITIHHHYAEPEDSDDDMPYSLFD